MLVIGAGVAGVTAAYHAVELGIQTSLQDRSPEPFSAQIECDTRWIHPHEYDWPNEHYESDTFPHRYLDWDLSGTPDLLHWKANTPSHVATSWRVGFGRWVDPNRQIVSPEGPIVWGRRTFPALTEQTNFEGYIRRLVPRAKFHLVVMCVGGRECCRVEGSKFRSFRFWEPDRYGITNYGVGITPRRTFRTLISGGGDGALQDFLRIACRKRSFELPVHALQILRKLLPFLQSCEAYGWMRDQVAALRGDIRRPDPSAMWKIHTEFFARVAAEEAGANLERAVDKLIDPSLFSQKRTIDLNFTQGHFRSVYFLNAFLARLFEWRIRERSGRSVFQPGARVKKIRSGSDSHVCARRPVECFLKPHTVAFELNDNDADAPELRTYDVIVLRHGIVS
jgi:hypothetical protein